jgi:Pyruvate/2-oxoacid:ferredoxin oxidoreductase delta subunit
MAMRILSQRLAQAKPTNLRIIKGNQMNENKDPWVHRSEGMRCKTCIWFVPKQVVVKEGAINELDPIYHLGRCRRHSPTMGGYPVVFVNDWCGDHRIDENKV